MQDGENEEVAATDAKAQAAAVKIGLCATDHRRALRGEAQPKIKLYLKL